MIYFSKVEKSEQPNDCEYAIFNEEKTLIAKAVIFHLDGDGQKDIMDIAEIKSYISIPVLIKKIIEYAKLVDNRCIMFPRICMRNNIYFRDDDNSSIYDNHEFVTTSSEEDSSSNDDDSGNGIIKNRETVKNYGINYNIYEHLEKNYNIENIIVNKIVNPVNTYNTIMPILFFKRKWKMNNPIPIRIEVVDNPNKHTAKTLSSIDTYCSIHSYKLDVASIKDKMSVKDEELYKNQRHIECCNLIFNESCLLDLYGHPHNYGKDTYLNIYIKGVNVKETILSGFRLNKWKAYTSNDILHIYPTLGYTYNTHIHYAMFSNITFYKDINYNKDAYNFFIDYLTDATTDKLPQIILNNNSENKKYIEKSPGLNLVNDEDNRISYIYLIREREFINKNEPVYKVGRTTQERGLTIERFKAYKKGSEIIFLKSVCTTKVNSMENVIKTLFNEKFKKHNDGTEYFIGSPDEMCKIIFNECVV